MASFMEKQMQKKLYRLRRHQQDNKNEKILCSCTHLFCTETQTISSRDSLHGYTMLNRITQEVSPITKRYLLLQHVRWLYFVVWIFSYLYESSVVRWQSRLRLFQSWNRTRLCFRIRLRLSNSGSSLTYSHISRYATRASFHLKGEDI